MSLFKMIYYEEMSDLSSFDTLSYSDESIIIEAFKEKNLINNKIQYGNVEYISKENIYKFY